MMKCADFVKTGELRLIICRTKSTVFGLYVSGFWHIHAKTPRACLKNALRKMCVTICGRFCSDEGVVVDYDNRIRTKYTAKWGVQIAGMIFQTHSSGIVVCEQ